MSHNVQKFGSVTIARARSSAELKRLLKDSWLKTDTIVIKPNWVGTDPMYGFTESEGLHMLFEALDNRFVVTESYNLGRGPPNGGVNFTVDGEEVSWKWLFSGKGWKWLEKHPSWDWFKEGGHGTALEGMMSGSSKSTALPTSSTSMELNMSMSQKRPGKDGQRPRKKSRKLLRASSLQSSLRSCMASSLRSYMNCKGRP